MTWKGRSSWAILSSIRNSGRATGCRWFVEHDLIEGVIYLPENLFYNTTAPGIILVLNKSKPADRKNKIFLLNAANEFTKGDPKNYLASDAIARTADNFSTWKQIAKYSRVVTRDEIAKNDFNISPSPYVHTGKGENIGRLLRSWSGIEEETAATDSALKKTLAQMGISHGARRALSASDGDSNERANKAVRAPTLHT